MAPMDGRLKGKVAVVTAATNGIALAIAQRLAEEGAKVLISSRKQENVDQAVKQLQAKHLPVKGVVCHAGNSEQRQRMLKMACDEFGGIDILVSNAGVNPYFGPLLDLKESHWDKTFDINVKSAFFLVKETVPYMEKRGGGSIILLSSIASYMASPMGNSIYGVSKLALVGLTKALASPCGERNIRVNALCPGFVKTNFSKALSSNEEMTNYYVDTFIPLKRAGVPEDMAGTAAFLASDDSRYMTGESVVVAGGMNSRL